MARVAHTSRDPGITISDYQFAPATITVHVGDTITWMNNGPAPHTATASNGSFDTGTLNKGQSASHTFTQAGTFAYICTIHPFMHGTVIVVAAATSNTQGQNSGTGSGSGSGAGSSASSTSANASTSGASSASTGSGLPNTGLNLSGALIAGVALIGAGTIMRRRNKSQL